MRTDARVKKWGNSLAVRIPRAIVADLGLSDNEDVQIDSNGSVATIKPLGHKKPSLDELLSAVTPQNIHQEADLGKPVGREIW